MKWLTKNPGVRHYGATLTENGQKYFPSVVPSQIDKAEILTHWTQSHQSSKHSMLGIKLMMILFHVEGNINCGHMSP